MSAVQDLAQDYVLGVLDVSEATGVEARLAAPGSAEDRDLAAAVGAFRDRLLPLDLTAPELPLRPGAWERLEAMLDEEERRAPGPGSAGTASAPANARVAPLPGRAGGGRWRVAALGAMAASAMLAAGLGWQALRAVDPAVMVVLLDQGGEPSALLEVSADNRVLVTPLGGVAPGPTQVFQVWTKPDPAGPPVSLGVLEQAARMVVENGALPEPAAGQLFEITIEPAGGSPTGLPTGPIVGVGNAQVAAD